MARTRFEPLADEDSVFRLVVVGSRFLPLGALLPIPDWIVPTESDEAEATARGRPAGLSVWDCGQTRVTEAVNIRYPSHSTTCPDSRAFAWEVVGLRVQRDSFPARRLDVVADPLDPAQGPGSGGHALIEGLKRPAGLERREQKRFLDEIVALVREHVAVS